MSWEVGFSRGAARLGGQARYLTVIELTWGKPELFQRAAKEADAQLCLTYK